METSQELTLKFMVALASNPSYANTQRDISEEALKIYTELKPQFLENYAKTVKILSLSNF